MKHVVFFSGGLGSWATAKRVIAEYGTDDVLLLFTDTFIEDKDLYRFIIETSGEMFGVDVSDLTEKARYIPEVHQDMDLRKGYLIELAENTNKRIPQLL